MDDEINEMMHRRRSFPPALLTLVLLSPPIHPSPHPDAPAPQVVPVLERLQKKLDALQGLLGRFVQRLDSANLGRDRVESGRFAILKPGLMRWEYEKPERKVAVTDGETTWLHLPEDNEVQIGRYPEDGGGASASLLSGRLGLDRDFRSRVLAADEAGSTGVAGGMVIELTPLSHADEFEMLILTVDPQRLEIRVVTLVDALGGRMTFEFFDLVENPALRREDFSFRIPAGAEVIDTR